MKGYRMSRSFLIMIHKEKILFQEIQCGILKNHIVLVKSNIVMVVVLDKGAMLFIIILAPTCIAKTDFVSLISFNRSWRGNTYPTVEHAFQGAKYLLSDKPEIEKEFRID